MARLFFLLHLILLLLFFLAFSSARVSLPLPQPADPLPAVNSDDSVSDSNSNPTILLPSQQPFSDSLPSHHPDTDEVNPDSVPLTLTSFRPINRHFPWRPFLFLSRRGYHCRHRRDHRLKPLGPRFRPYGNDIIPDEDLSFHQVIGRSRHSESRFEHENELGTSEDMMNPGHPHPHHHHHHHHHHRHRRNEHDHFFADEDGDERRWSWERENHHGFMTKIRHLFFH